MWVGSHLFVGCSFLRVQIHYRIVQRFHSDALFSNNGNSARKTNKRQITYKYTRLPSVISFCAEPPPPPPSSNNSACATTSNRHMGSVHQLFAGLFRSLFLLLQKPKSVKCILGPLFPSSSSSSIAPKGISLTTLYANNVRCRYWSMSAGEMRSRVRQTLRYHRNVFISLYVRLEMQRINALRCERAVSLLHET